MEVKLSHSLENMTSLFFVGLWVGGGNEEVVYVDDEPFFGDHVSEGVIHESLECSGGIAETEEHYCWFKEPFVGNESHLPLVTILDANVVVPPADIKLGEVVSIFQLIHKVGDEREEIGIAGGVFV